MSSDLEPRASSRVGLVLLTVSVVCWGVTPRVTAIAADYAAPLTLTTLRAIPAAVVLLVAMVAARRRFPQNGYEWLATGVSGVLMVTVFLAAFTEAVIRAGPGPTIVLASTSPFFVVAATWMMTGERPLGATWLGIVVGFGGVVLIMSSSTGGDGSRTDTLIGLMLSLAAASAWAAGTMIVRAMAQRSADVDMLGVTTGQYLIGGAVMLLVSVVFEGSGNVDWSQPRLWWSVAFISIVGSGLATVAYLTALRSVDAARASTWLFIAPAVAVALDAAMGEPPGGVVLAGMFLTVAGVAIVNVSSGFERRSRVDA